MSLQIVTCVVSHIGDRAEQQDRVALFPHPRNPRVMLAALADGMGGHSGGVHASRQVVHTAYHALDQFAVAEPWPAFLEGVLNEAHLMIRAGRFLNEQDPHSTGVLLVMEAGGAQLRAAWAHCGDSRLYRFRAGVPVSVTRDHSLIEELVGRGFLTREQAEARPDKNVLVTSLGGEEAPRIDVAEADDIGAGEQFLLCSDGLWAYFSPEELARQLNQMSPRQAAEWLIDQARERAGGHGDNLSLAIISVVAKEATKAPVPGRP